MGEAGREQEAPFFDAVTAMIERLEGGAFPVDPESCDYCEFAGLCRYVETPMTEEES